MSITDNIKQKKRIYAPVQDFKKIKFQNEGIPLAMDENIPPYIVGLAVDYLTRYILTQNKEKAFSISLEGAKIRGKEKKAKKFLSHIDQLTDESITYACKLVFYDRFARNPEEIEEKHWLSPKRINPDALTIQNIRTMVLRSIQFFQEYGPVVSTGFGFRPHGYTKKIKGGDGDFLTKDTIWDFKVSKYDLTPAQTLQILMYYIMGKESGNDIFKNVKYIGIYNPRKNIAYQIAVKDIKKKNKRKLRKKMGF